MRNVSRVGRTAVPGAAEHPSVALVDTVSAAPRGQLRDELDTPDALADWLLARDLISPDAVLYEHCWGRIVEFRQSLRDLFTAHVEGSAPSLTTIQALNRALTRASGARLLHFDPATGFTRSADHPATQVIEHVMALIAEDAAALLTGKEASMLTSCQAKGCLQFFLRQHARRQWCSTRCGDRVRAARAYTRRRTSAS